MNKKVLGCLFLLVMSIRGDDGVETAIPSFTLVNNVVKDEKEAQERPLSVIVTYESLKNAKQITYHAKTRQTLIPLVVEANKYATRVNISEYNTHNVLVAYGMYAFTSDVRNVLASKKSGLAVTRSPEKYKHEDRYKLVFAIDDLKNFAGVPAAGGE